MKILWQYLDHFQINLDLDESTNVPQVREDDFSIINVLLENGWRGGRLVIANRVRKHKKVHRGSCITAMDGHTLLPFIFDRERGSSTRVWSLEEPMASDFSVWQQALRVFSTSTRKLYNRLGELVNVPHNNNTWTCNDDQTILCQSLGRGSFSLYKLDTPFRFTRSGTPFTFHRYTSVDPEFSRLATVLSLPHPAVRLQSTCPMPTIPTPPTTFLGILHSWPNQSLWRTLKVDGDGSWILDALVAGSLDVVYDGSFMKKVTPKVCSMALLMRCRITGYELTCTWAEMSNSADNYRGELLGALCCSLLLKAATAAPVAYSPRKLLRHCDNMGVVKHGNAVYGSLKDGQAQADIIRLFRSIDNDLPVPFKYQWVESHTNDPRKRHVQRTHIHRHNDRVDNLAKSALIESVMENIFISSDFPFEIVRVRAGSKKLTGPLRPFVTSHHSRRVAREVFGYGIRGKKLVSEECFDLILFWEIIPKALKEFPSSFKDWLSKHVTGCCGVNRFLSKWEPGVTNHCPCCHRFNEDIYHITTCTDAGRTTIFNQMVDELGGWLEDNHTPPDLTEMIVLYLRGRNTVKMQDLIHYRGLTKILGSYFYCEYTTLKYIAVVL
jgi:hypothetical protein